MSELPTGTVTLLFTDVEGSTRLLQRAGDAYPGLLEAHRLLLRSVFERHGGVEVGTEGDAFFVAFPSAKDAVAAAGEAQQALAAHPWAEGHEIRVRIGIHTGEPRLVERNYVGLDVHRAARVMAAGHGGQVLLSQSTRDLLDEQFELRDLGQQRLKDLSEPQRLYQLRIEGLPDEFPALKTLEHRPTNLPVQPTPLVGRVRELGELAQLLQREDLRLLTLTGTGGTGKTRLALQAAADLVDRFPDGVFFIALAPITDPALFLPAAAQTLGLREAPGEPLGTTLKNYLAEKAMLLLLDNFEQIISAAPEVAELLAGAPKLKVVVTSRVRLQLSGEHEYPVSPLPVPHLEAGERRGSVAGSDAVTLFVERARAVKPDFALTAENVQDVAEICARLDGLPLALELAAARIKLLPPQALLPRLEQRLQLLTGGARDLAERQQTLRNTIDWSYSLLRPEEQTLFARLAVFVGGRTLEAAEAICSPEGDIDVLEAMTTLLDNSLIRQEESEGDARFVMLETIHEYARGRLGDSGEELEEMRNLHALYFHRFAESADAEIYGPHFRVWLRRVATETPNLRAALAWFEESDYKDAQLWMVGWLAAYWRQLGLLRETRGQLALALAGADGASPGARAIALHSASFLALHEGRTEQAVRLESEAVALARLAGDDRLLSGCLTLQATVAAAAGDFALARANSTEALGLARAIGADSMVVTALEGLFSIAFLSGDLAEAKAWAEESVEVARRAGDEVGIAYGLINVGHSELLLGRPAAAATSVLEAVDLCVLLAALEGVAISFALSAAVASAVGSAKDAARLLGRADELMDELGATPDPVDRSLHERTVAELRGRLGEKQLELIRGEGRLLSVDEAVEVAKTAMSGVAEVT